MPPILPVQPPAAPQSKPASPSANESSKQFSPHLDNAIAQQQEKKTSNREEQKTQKQAESQPREELAGGDKKSPEAGSETVTNPQDNQEQTVTTIKDDSGQSGNGPKTFENIISQNTTATNQELYSTLFAFLQESQTAGAGNSQNNPLNTLLKGQNAALSPATAELSPATAEAGITSGSTADRGNTIVGSIDLENLIQAETSTVTFNGGNGVKGGRPLTGQRDAIIVQLQQIINNSTEKGAVSITRNSPSNNSLETIGNLHDITLSGLGRGDLEFSRATSEKSNLNLNPLRQNTQEQYFEAKLAAQNSPDTGSGTQGNQQNFDNNNSSQQPGSTFSQTPIVQTADTSASAFQSTVTSLETPAAVISDASKAITLPSGTVVHDHEIMQQVIERFQLTRRSLETKLNIKLHPAELGELKIDLTVSEGSIRANVIAQSQQVQEIIERNMAKLRLALEEQGFTVDEISVTSESDSVDDFNLFDSQLFSRNDYSPSSGQQTHPVDTVTGFEALIEETLHQSPGVNVKA